MKKSIAVAIAIAAFVGLAGCNPSTKRVPVPPPAGAAGIIEGIYGSDVPIDTSGRKCPLDQKLISLRPYGSDGVADRQDTVVKFCLPVAEADMYKAGDAFSRK